MKAKFIIEVLQN